MARGFRRNGNLMRYLDFFNDIHKCWATKYEVMRLCGCNEEEAFIILHELDYKAREKNMGIKCTNGELVVPMSFLLNYLGDERLNRINRYHDSLLEFYR